MSETPEMRQLPSPATDGITCLNYLSQNNMSSSSSTSLIASSSWDGNIYIHDTAAMKKMCSHGMESGPLLAMSVDSVGDCIFTGGVDGSVRKFDIATSTVTTIGHHSPHIEIPASNDQQLACSCLSSLSPNDNTPTTVLASAGWDSNFYLWDVRVSNGNSSSKSRQVSCIELPDKAFSMDVDPSTGTRLVVATAGRRTCFIDVRMNKAVAFNNNAADATALIEDAKLVLNRESSLKYQTRVSRFFPDGTGIAVGSIEGRVAIEFLNELGIESPGGMKKYAFKCHRVGDTVYPVNAIAFHPKHGTFATGGCDGSVVTWDGLNKKKLTTMHTFATSISAMCFNHDGSELAIASSYTFEEGDRDHPRDEIYVRKVLDSELLPKAKKDGK